MSHTWAYRFVTAAEGLIESRHGIGTFVKDGRRRQRRSRNRYGRARGDKKLLSSDFEHRIIFAGRQQVPQHIAEAMNVAPATEVVVRRRNLYDITDGRLEEIGASYIPVEIAGDTPRGRSARRTVGHLGAQMRGKPEWMWRHATELRNHWWWRPGWQIGTRFCAFHLAVGESADLTHLVALYQEALRNMVGFDPIPREWLHITMQGLAFVDDISPEDLASVVKTARTALADVEPFRLVFNRPLIRPEALVLVPEDVQCLEDLRNTVRSAIEKALRQGTIDLGSTDFQPHVSFAYVNADQPAVEALTALEGVESTATSFRVDEVPLIEMHRDNRMYEWRMLDSLPLAGNR